MPADPASASFRALQLANGFLSPAVEAQRAACRALGAAASCGGAPLAVLPGTAAAPVACDPAALEAALEGAPPAAGAASAASLSVDLALYDDAFGGNATAVVVCGCVQDWRVASQPPEPNADGFVQAGKCKKGSQGLASGCAAVPSELQRAIEHLEAFPSPGGGGDEFVAERLADLRAQKEEAAAALAADKEAGLSPAARLRKAANTASKAERKAAGARKALAAATSEASEAEATLQAAHDRLEDAELCQREAQDHPTAVEEEAANAKASQERLRTRTIPTAHSVGNFARALELTTQQLQAEEEMLVLQEPEATARPRKRWGDSCLLDGGDIDSDSDIDLGPPAQPAAERGQAQRRPPAAGPWL
ncbi:unnamed protein product [Prorocentrum cordatum]|uniref:Uncharacterized protein n=1 Tax=Prorocentrum cordatum TaxID=2364126 RepID=A0ABN9SAJ5_9DINO|nr:unnamed protein product [Polarella glacialis]